MFLFSQWLESESQSSPNLAHRMVTMGIIYGGAGAGRGLFNRTKKNIGMLQRGGGGDTRPSSMGLRGGI